MDRLNATGRFLDSRFGLYSPNHKALICGYFGPKKLRAKLDNTKDRQPDLAFTYVDVLISRISKIPFLIS